MIWKSKKPKSKAWRIINSVTAIIVLPFALIFVAPQLLAWPHKVVVGDTSVYAEAPISSEINRVLARSDALLRRSTIYSTGYGKQIFLTDGGWRWKLLAFRSSGAFGLSRPLGSIIINRNSVRENWVNRGDDIGGIRSLSSIIAHERTHGLIRTHFGLLSDLQVPTWKREGYCEYIAGETSLTATQVADLRRRGIDHPAIVYFEGQAKMQRLLDVEGQTVDAVFAE
ncbi:MAG: hypothetical protein ABL918_02685 [Chakrabartia sp.]